MKLIVANLKMNLLSSEINEYINYFKDKNYSNVIFAPTNIYLSRFVHNGLVCASQDVGMENSGAYTGDTSASQLKSIGVNYAIVGHSERKKYYHDEYFDKKIMCVLDQKMTPILCIGETKEEKESIGVLETIKRRLNEIVSSIDKSRICDIIIAYEPVWAIGSGLLPSNEEINGAITFIKNYIKETYDTNIKVLYGGSVNNNCINELEKIKSLDGYLVGGCSIKKEEFDKLINAIK